MLDSELTLEDREVKKKSHIPLSIEKLVKDLYMRIAIQGSKCVLLKMVAETRGKEHVGSLGIK